MKWKREPVLAFRLSDDEPDFVEVDGRKYRMNKEWAVIPLDFFIMLLEKAK